MCTNCKDSASETHSRPKPNTAITHEVSSMNSLLMELRKQHTILLGCYTPSAVRCEKLMTQYSMLLQRVASQIQRLKALEAQLQQSKIQFEKDKREHTEQIQCLQHTVRTLSHAEVSPQEIYNEWVQKWLDQTLQVRNPQQVIEYFQENRELLELDIHVKMDQFFK